MPTSDAEIAASVLHEESLYRFPSFSANDAVTLGLSLRKRFRASRRHARGKGLVISIQTIAGHTLFACTVGDLGGISGVGDVSLESWTCLEGMINVAKRTGHSSYYVEKGMGAMGKTNQTGQTSLNMNLQKEFLCGGAFPIWLENAQCCPIAIVGCFSGSSVDDHNLVVAGVRDYINKMFRNGHVPPPASNSSMPTGATMPIPQVVHHYDHSSEFM
ncbi:hypothetical protein NEOLEDRAFT_1155390 [Neolentinus lepideus HHB14362 ss-1]|uniref:DUF336-domain-containing protein n=1 Tax=Neolentinus lepideus HHB14362 ss-1 TaxID=1314782 RepID=A0A165TQX3_9AGAM|nr:hypothetical protein NEOLEDRAFT_1155390 [Neolentinus lepideus HHB14362 ss-1]